MTEEKTAEDTQMQEQVQRILRSSEFRNSEMLQRLLQYLADKSAAGEADHLKEYTVAIEGLGKSTSYDPQQKSAVRILMGRLRQKLSEYYQAEGKGDSVQIELAKGSFQLTIKPHQHEPVAEEKPASPVMVVPDHLAKRLTAPQIRFPTNLLVGILLGISIYAGGSFVARSIFKSSRDAALAASWTPELDALWSPFTASSRPLIVSIEDPLFVELRSNPGVYYRDRSLNKWKDLQESPTIQVIGKALKNPDIQPSRYYTAFGEVEASLLLGKLLSQHVPTFSLAKTSQLTWQQMADDNVLFIGVENLFFGKIQGLSTKPQLIPELGGIRNLQPTPGKPAFFADQYVTAPTEQGVVYALVSRLPGPSGCTEIESFTSNRSAGYVGAVQWFTDPKFARVLTENLKGVNGGKMPRYYQVLLRVEFKDDVPTSVSYVLSREIH